MNHNTPLSPRPLHHLSEGRRRVMTAAQLRAHGVSTAETEGQCRSGGPWQELLPGVYLLHPGPPTSEERLHAVLMYTAREPSPGVPAQPGPDKEQRPPYPEAVITGLAALNLHGFAAVPPLPSLDRIDVLVPRLRRLRSTGCARLLRTSTLPTPQYRTGLPVAPVPRALADAVADLTDAGAVRRLLTEAVRGGHCEPAAIVRELNQARLLSRPHVVDAVDSLLAEGRAIAEDRLQLEQHGRHERLGDAAHPVAVGHRTRGAGAEVAHALGRPPGAAGVPRRRRRTGHPVPHGGPQRLAGRLVAAGVRGEGRADQGGRQCHGRGRHQGHSYSHDFPHLIPSDPFRITAQSEEETMSTA